MATFPKTIIQKLWERGLVRLPASVIEISELAKGSPVEVTYGKNFNCVIIIPSQMKVSDRQRERMRILTNEALDSNS